MIESQIEKAARVLAVTIGADWDDMKGRSRRQRYVVKRHLIMRQLRSLGYHPQEIGRVFNRDRTSVLYATREIR